MTSAHVNTKRLNRRHYSIEEIIKLNDKIHGHAHKAQSIKRKKITNEQ